MAIKAIETRWNGYRFRSRTEARWAVFFDALGLAFEYEKEGFVVNGIPYLPDFYLPELDKWIEVKGDKPTHAECDLVLNFAKEIQTGVQMLWGDVWHPSERGGIIDFAAHVVSDDIGWQWAECEKCHRVTIAHNAWAGHFSCSCMPMFVRVMRYLDRADGSLMHPALFIASIKERGLSLDVAPDGINLLLTGPKEARTDEMRTYIRQEKESMIEHLLSRSVPPDMSSYQIFHGMYTMPPSERIHKAFIAAREARFEHGEKPETMTIRKGRRA